MRKWVLIRANAVTNSASFFDMDQRKWLNIGKLEIFVMVKFELNNSAIVTW